MNIICYYKVLPSPLSSPLQFEPEGYQKDLKMCWNHCDVLSYINRCLFKNPSPAEAHFSKLPSKFTNTAWQK